MSTTGTGRSGTRDVTQAPHPDQVLDEAVDTTLALRRLAAGLTPDQHEAVFADAPHLCIVAGAGSGKTRVLTGRIARRILDGTADPAATLAVTFTRKAAGELRTRLWRLGVDDDLRCGTFHAIAWAQLRRHWEVNGRSPLKILDYKAPVVARALDRCGVRPNPAVVRTVAADIERAKSGAPARGSAPAAPATYRSETSGSTTSGPEGEEFLSRDTFDEVHRVYEAEKRRRGVLDFEDMILLLTRTLHEDRGFAHVLGRQVRHVFVDEYQDVNAAQFALLRSWMSLGAGEGRHPDLCVVGDDDQSIYAFRGANPGHLTRFSEAWADARVIRLEHNFRCSPQVLRVANRLLADAPVGSGKRLQATGPDGPVPIVRSHESQIQEAAWARKVLRSHARGRDGWGRTAILVRTNAQLLPFEQALTDARIPFVVGGGGSFLAHPSVKRAVEALRSTAPPPGLPLSSFVADTIRDIRAEETVAAPDHGASPPLPAEADGADPLDVLADLAVEFEDAWHSHPHARSDHASHPGPRRHERPPSGRSPVSGELAPSRPPVSDFLTHVVAEVSGEAAGGGSPNAVSLLTMHRAKGLEFDTVIVAGVEDGLIPIHHAASPEQIEEERRLLYVALTRARRNLYISWCERRTANDGNSRSRRPSRFLLSIAAAVADAGAAATPSTNWRSWLSTARHEASGEDGTGTAAAQCADGTPTAGIAAPDRVGPDGNESHEGLSAALNDWRARRAVADRVRPTSVLSDLEVRRLAATEPTSHAALAGILDRVKFTRYGSEILALCNAEALVTRSAPHP